LIPRLNEIYKDIIEFVAEQSAHIAEEFVRDMKQVVSVSVNSNQFTLS